MNNNIKIAVLGGDRRQIYALDRLAKSGAQVCVYGLPEDAVRLSCDEKICFCKNVEEAVFGASVVLLPFVSSVDGVKLNCPLVGGEAADIKLFSLLKMCDDSAIIVGAKLTSAFCDAARRRGLAVVDLLENESLEIKNAYVTAEAAVSVAMNSLCRTIGGARVAVTGFGRISKQLCKLIDSLGARVTVAARRESDLAYADTFGYKTVKISGEGWSTALASSYDIIFNTVPSRIFDRGFFELVDKKTLLIELASAPGGFDLSAAQEHSANVIWALSLPGKYAPESAGELIAEFVKGLIEGEVSPI